MCIPYRHLPELHPFSDTLLHRTRSCPSVLPASPKSPSRINFLICTYLAKTTLSEYFHHVKMLKGIFLYITSCPILAKISELENSYTCCRISINSLIFLFLVFNAILMRFKYSLQQSIGKITIWCTSSTTFSGHSQSQVTEVGRTTLIISRNTVEDTKTAYLDVL